MDAHFRYWFLTSTTYGSWLPGDERGFVSHFPQEDGQFEIHNVIDTPYDRDVPEWQNACERRLTSPPVYLDQLQAEAVLEQFQETASHRQWKLYIASIMRNHFHVLIGASATVHASHILRDLKAYSSRRLNQHWTKPASGTWWTESGSRRPLSNERACYDVYEYILNQSHCLAQWRMPLDGILITET